MFSLLAGALGSNIAGKLEDTLDFIRNITDRQREYNLLLNEQLRINSDIQSSVFLTDYLGRLTDATKAFNDAQKNYLKGIIELTENKDFNGILRLYPELIVKAADGSKKLNVELAKTLLDSAILSDETKNILNNLIAWGDAIEDASDQTKNVISDLSGSLGNSLRDALVGAFSDGTDAAIAFKGEVNKVLENIMSNMIFNKAFEGAFKTLEDEMMASYWVTGDKSWLDDFQRFYSQAPNLIDDFNQGMADAQAAAQAAGFNIFGGEQAQPAGLAGQIRREITEETGSELAGLIRRQSDDLRVVRDYTKSGVTHLIKIEKNTQDTVFELQKAVTELKDINKNTKQAYTGSL
jgi:hypothetical protein